MSVSRKALRKAVKKMSRGKEKQVKPSEEQLDKLLRQISYEQGRKYRNK